MVRKLVFAAAALLCTGAGVSAAVHKQTVLPTEWRLTAPQGPVQATGTMPQGLALSANGATLAVIDSGVEPAGLQLFGHHGQATIPLVGAFGAPIWLDARHVLAAGGSANALYTVDTQTRTVRSVALGSGSWPAAIALSPSKRQIAVCNDGSASLSLGTLPLLRDLRTIAVGAHPSAALFSADGKTVYVAVRQPSEVAVIDVASHAVVRDIPVGLHPGALALSQNGRELFVAETDDDAVGVVDTRSNRVISTIPVGLHDGRLHGEGASPNALAVDGAQLFVSLAGEDAVARIAENRVVERIPAGWYPTGVAVGRHGTLYVIDGTGERAPANPEYNPFRHDSSGYVGDITIGSLRTIPASAYGNAQRETNDVIADAMPQWTPAPASATVLRANGPIRHVIYVIKENRSYDQVLGDVAGANGDPRLVWFGKNVTPNQHALAQRFGIFDNAYVDAEVSASGHNWTDAAFANDYVQRFWPPNYGGRRDLYDFQDGQAPDVPRDGYLWDAAKRAGITYRDYGEDTTLQKGTFVSVTNHAGLAGHFDPRFVGWDLNYSDLARYAEWHREFMAFAASGTLPQFEIVYFPNDHTSGTVPGKPTPQAYVALNDLAVGDLVDDVSHSRYWKSTAIFILEDDAQDGPDHVSDQRSTFYLASPYARGGVQHARYSTAGFVRSMELLLGLPPLSIYDATARPLYAAFSQRPANAAPFRRLVPRVNLHAVNQRTAYAAAVSARLDFREPDAVNARLLNSIIAHTVHHW